MTTILETRDVPDGWDVDVIRNNGRRQTLHFVDAPEDIQSAVEEVDAQLDIADAQIAAMGML